MHAIPLRRQCSLGRSKHRGGYPRDHHDVVTGLQGARRRFVEDNPRPIRQSDNDLIVERCCKRHRIRPLPNDRPHDGAQGKLRAVCTSIIRTDGGQRADRHEPATTPHHVGCGPRCPGTAGSRGCTPTRRSLAPSRPIARWVTPATGGDMPTRRIQELPFPPIPAGAHGVPTSLRMPPYGPRAPTGLVFGVRECS